MRPIPEIISISELRLHQNEVLGRLAESPVVLTQYGKLAAVLVDPEQWNNFLEEYEDLYLSVEALKVELALERGETGTISLEEFEAELGGVPAGN
jgi:PHD/YefM family antitoxin component YafN of YafNO toxin-antitoxin module